MTTVTRPTPFNFKTQAPITFRAVIIATYAAALGAPKRVKLDSHRRPVKSQHYDSTREGTEILAALTPMAETPEESARRRQYWISAAQAAESAKILLYNPLSKRRYLNPEYENAARAAVADWSAKAGGSPVSLTDRYQVTQLISAFPWHAEFVAWCAIDDAITAYADSLIPAIPPAPGLPDVLTQAGA